MPASAARQHHRVERRASRLLAPLLTSLLVLLVALASRFFRLAEAYEVHIDEVSYAEVSRSVAEGTGLQLNGGPFHLHPPGVFVLMATWMRVAGIDARSIPLVEQLRPVEAVTGALTCLLVCVLVMRAAGRVAGLLAGLSLALDPFANRWDSRVFLEAPAMFWCVVMMLLLLRVAEQNRPRGWALVAAGLAAGLAIVSKEPYAVASAGPVAVLLATGWVLRRRDAATVLLVACCCWAGYVSAIVVTGNWNDWQLEKLSGFRRLIGVEQITGYNSEGHETLGSQLATNLVSFGTSYALVGLGSICSLALLLGLRPYKRTPPPGSPRHRDGLVLLAVWQLTSAAYLGYAISFGTLEEQTFCLLLTPSVVTVGAVSALLVRHHRLKHALRAGLALFIVLQLASTLSVRLGTDNGYQRLDTWMRAEVPDSTVLGATEDTGQFVLRGVVINTEGDVPDMIANRDDLVLISTALANRGYGTARPPALAALQENGRLVFCASGRTLGQLRVYDVREITGGSGAAAATVWPEVSTSDCG